MKMIDTYNSNKRLILLPLIPFIVGLFNLIVVRQYSTDWDMFGLTYLFLFTPFMYGYALLLEWIDDGFKNKQ